MTADTTALRSQALDSIRDAQAVLDGLDAAKQEPAPSVVASADWMEPPPTFTRGREITDGRDGETVGAYLARWLEVTVKPHVRPHTFVIYESQVRNHITPAIGGIPLATLGHSDVQRMLNELTSTRNVPGRQNGLSPHTIHQTKRVLHAALEVAFHEGLIDRNPVRGTKTPSTRKRKVKTWSPAETRHFLTSIEHDRLYALYVVSIAVGLRQGEALGLRWGDVNLAEATLTPRYQLQRGELVALKTESSGETIALPRMVVASLEGRRAHQEERELPSRFDLIFTEPDGEPIKARSLRNAFRSRLSEAGLPMNRWHDLRHMTASLYAGTEVHPAVIASIMRHVTPKMTEQYTHVRLDQQRAAVERMDERIGARASEDMTAVLPSPEQEATVHPLLRVREAEGTQP
jgi:integrase